MEFWKDRMLGVYWSECMNYKIAVEDPGMGQVHGPNNEDLGIHIKMPDAIAACEKHASENATPLTLDKEKTNV